MDKDLEKQAITQARGLAIDQIQAANSGHPGMALGAMAEVFELWAHHMKFMPGQGRWANRDRFVLSAGHASALFYSLSYLFGTGYSLDDLKNFRQLGSRTQGHPTYNLDDHIETTTGPLGQGLATAVGMALAERHLAAMFNTDQYPVFDYYTFVLTGEGCLEEGIGYEATSYAGALGLDKLILLYDSNKVSIDGHTEDIFHEDIQMRFEALGWDYQEVMDGNDTEAIGQAIEKAKRSKGKPSIIEIHSKIGYASPVEDDAKAHGSPLGEEGVRLTKEKLGLPVDQFFYVSDEVLNYTRHLKDSVQADYEAWEAMVHEYMDTQGEKGKLLFQYFHHKKPDCDQLLRSLTFEDGQASRGSSGEILNAIEGQDPFLIGGSADLSGSNKTILKNSSWIARGDYKGKNVHFGIREHAMGAIVNGLTLSGFHAYGATFLSFTGYMLYALRLAALMKIPSLFIYTHDDITVGEDGETHQPVEQLSQLRLMPNLKVWRPCGGIETAAAYASWLKMEGPMALALGRNGIPQPKGTDYDKAQRGAYVLAEKNVKDGKPDLILIGTGSELLLAIEACEDLGKEGKSVRLVSMPCMEVFEEQDQTYKDSVLPPDCKKRLAIETGPAALWYRYVGTEGKILSVERFGESGKAKDLLKAFGFTKEHISEMARELL